MVIWLQLEEAMFSPVIQERRSPFLSPLNAMDILSKNKGCMLYSSQLLFYSHASEYFNSLKKP